MQRGDNDFRELLVLILRSFLFAAAAKKATNVMHHQGVENEIEGVAAWSWKPRGAHLWSTACGFGLPILRSVCNGVTEDTEEAS